MKVGPFKLWKEDNFGLKCARCWVTFTFNGILFLLFSIYKLWYSWVIVNHSQWFYFVFFDGIIYLYPHAASIFWSYQCKTNERLHRHQCKIWFPLFFIISFPLIWQKNYLRMCNTIYAFDDQKWSKADKFYSKNLQNVFHLMTYVKWKSAN